MEERELPLLSKKKKTKVTLMNEAGNEHKLLNLLLITLACCLMMARRLHVCEMDLKFATLRKINACNNDIILREHLLE